MALIQEKKTTREKQKENKSYVRLQQDINGTMMECDELRGRIKVSVDVNNLPSWPRG